ncbi:MAG: Eco57I restriction-modification methylase domain-containing protein [Alphaproteobacteria bacterium]|nr:Eco57I restriction-modification methylase domain-containing protein [Alphaproteobacteria bacterium]
MRDSNLEEIIFGRVDPYIYAFTTNTIPNYLKVGDTYRSVRSRLEEWRRYFPELKKVFEESAKIKSKSGDVFFRDFAVHDYLEKTLNKERLTREILNKMHPCAYFSKEFFKNATSNDVKEAMKDIRRSFENNDNRYIFYDGNKETKEFTFKSEGPWDIRDNQQETIDRFKTAIDKGRTNLLMYAVMRFGKSFTSLCCAKEMKAKIVLVVSAKADVKDEWKKNVEKPKNINEKYVFIDVKKLKDNKNIINEIKSQGKWVVIFLTLQDLQGPIIKKQHKEVFNNQIDLLIVDETHYGARAEKYGKVLQQEKDSSVYNEYIKDVEKTKDRLKTLKAKVTLHLSGTPYRILMGNEFTKDDIIAFYQFTDIIKAQEKWDKKNISDDEPKPEWENPYFGFPQMLRFAFHPSAAAKAKLEELKKNGATYAFSELFEPQSKTKTKDCKHKKFIHEVEVLDLFEIIDGSKKDKNVLGFLDFEKIKKGNMCRHIVCVLPYCAACDALEKLICDNKKKFKNLSKYEIINISGIDHAKKYRSVDAVKRKIKECEENNKKTLTLTVNRMLTGSTVEQWDTMIFLKGTHSPQDYDQAIFRLQSQYIKKYTGKDGEIKYNMKPQTVLVDFDPDRMFQMQESKSSIYNLNTDKKGNSQLEERIREELSVSPIITINQDKIKQVEAVDIIDAVIEYSGKRGVWEEVTDIPVDFEVLKDPDIFDVINSQGEIGSNRGLKIEGNVGEDTDLDVPSVENTKTIIESKQAGSSGEIEKDDMKSLEKKFRTYYSRILFFAFLTKDNVLSLDGILQCIKEKDNARIAKHLNLEPIILEKIRNKMDSVKLGRLDGKIYTISKLAHDETIEPIKRAETALIKFGRFSESEVPTPINICDDMIGVIPNDTFFALKKGDNIMLDISSKAGEFAIAICKRCQSLGIRIKDITDSIWSIPTSSIAYEFTYKVYKFLGLDVDTIAKDFTSYDILKVKNETEDLNYKQIVALLTQNKKLGKIKLTDNIKRAGVNTMQVQAVVGNPPYQEARQNTSDNPIYHLFMNVAFQLSDKVSFITPARFLFNAGKTPKEWNKKMLNDEHIKVLSYERESKKYFPDTSINGGIAITYRDALKKYGAIKSFRPYKEIGTIADKVLNHKNFESIKDIVYLQNKFNLDALYKDYPAAKVKISSSGNEKRIVSSAFDNLAKVFSDKARTKSYVPICGLSNRKRIFKYIESKYLESGSNIDYYKVLLSSADGASGTIGKPVPARVIGDPVVLDAGVGYTQTFISIGAFKRKKEAENLYKYLKTRFVRFMVGTIKATNGLKIEVWSNVPKQDFSNKSDIDWSKPIKDIDKQLYKKYGLDKQEIDFIESMIKPME